MQFIFLLFPCCFFKPKVSVIIYQQLSKSKLLTYAEDISLSGDRRAMRQVITKLSSIPKVDHHLHHRSLIRAPTWRGNIPDWAFLVNRFESWGALRPTRSSVSLCGQNCNSLWLPSPFYFRFSSTLSTEARISWNILYSPDSNFWSCFSELLFPLPRGKEESRWKSAKALKEDLAGYIGKIKRKPGQLDHGKQRKILYTKPAGTTSQRT